MLQHISSKSRYLIMIIFKELNIDAIIYCNIQFTCKIFPNYPNNVFYSYSFVEFKIQERITLYI